MSILRSETGKLPSRDLNVPCPACRGGAFATLPSGAAFRALLHVPANPGPPGGDLGLEWPTPLGPRNSRAPRAPFQPRLTRSRRLDFGADRMTCLPGGRALDTARRSQISSDLRCSVGPIRVAPHLGPCLDGLLNAVFGRRRFTGYGPAGAMFESLSVVGRAYPSATRRG